MEPKIKPTNSLDPHFLRERMANRLSKRILINNTRGKRHVRFMNNRLFFILGIDDDEDDNDDPGIAAAPGSDPLPSGGWDGIFVGTPESVELLAMAVLA